MTRLMFRWTLVLTLTCLFGGFAAAAPALAGTTYYIDHAAGDDANEGTAADAAFRHAPGDPQAGDRAADVRLAPGDRVLFKGGVVYRGSLRVRDSGTADAPIILDGNTDGSFGDGPAILDGGELVTGWEPCPSAEACGGNPNYERIYRARVPARDGLNAQSLALVQGERLLFVAQYPNPDEPFYDGHSGNYLDARGAHSRTQLTDERLAELGRDHLVGAWAYLRTTSNFVDFQPITDYDEETQTITYERTNRDTTGRWSIANALHELVLDGPGQYVFDPEPVDGEHWVYVWPYDDADPNDAGIPYNVRHTAIDFGRDDVAHVSVQGFVIRHYGRGINGRGTTGITIRDNELTRIRTRGSSQAIHFVNVRDHVVADNYIHHNQRTNAIQQRIGQRVVNAGNRIEMVARSPIRFYDIQHGQLIDNTIINCRGVHANALTLYLGCEDILVARNVVHRSNIAMTIGDGRRIYVINNILTSAGNAVGIWPHSYNENIYFLNNHITPFIFVNHREATGFVFKNNILGRIDGYPLDDTHTLSHNLYLEPKAGLAEGEFIVEDVDRVVRDAAAEDFRPVPAGPTIDMGTDVSDYYRRDLFPDFDFDVDLAGNRRVHGQGIDIGPYERPYEEGELDDRPAIATGADAEPPAPIDAYSRVPGGEAIILRGIEFSDEGGGSVRQIEPENLATYDHVRGWNDEGHWLAYRVEVPEAGDYELRLRYAADLDAPRRIEVNGSVVVDRVNLADTGGWSAFRTVAIDAPLPLTAGENVIRLTSLGGRGSNLDQLTLARDGEDVASITAGDFDGEGGGRVDVVPAPHHGLFAGWNNDGHWLEWTIDAADAGHYKIVLRYATLSTSPREFRVNGDVVEHLEMVTLNTTPGWRVTREATLPAPIELRDGRNTLRITSRGGFGFNVDEIKLVPVQEQ